jgi:hypothetical protein
MHEIIAGLAQGRRLQRDIAPLPRRRGTTSKTFPRTSITDIDFCL